MYLHMAESATEACCNPARLVGVIASSRLAMLGASPPVWTGNVR